MTSGNTEDHSGFGLKFILPTGEELLFTSLPINIGRSAQNNLVINHGSVSAMHAQVFFDERLKDVCIKDRDSLNGLFIDQKPTRLNVLHDGAKISLGDAVIDFRDTGYIHVEHSE